MGGVIRFLLNGDPVEVTNPDPSATLLDWLRGPAGLRATKEGCREGDCGACTVVLARAGNGRLEFLPVNSCLVLLGSLDGRLVITAEGLAENGKLHAVQRAMVTHHGSQCGFCTPGMVMSLFALQHSADGPDKVHEALGGNLCRCTGYRPIVDAARVCGEAPDDRWSRNEAEFVADLERLRRTETAEFGVDGRVFVLPVTPADLLNAVAERPNAWVTAGGTDVSLRITKLNQVPEAVILTDRVAGFDEIEETREALTIGASVTYAEALPALDRLAPDFGKLVRRIGSRQIRALGTLAGNIGNASPIGDSAPPMLALRASLRLLSTGGEREVPLDDFFTGYRKTVLRPGEVISAIRIPRPPEGARLVCHKIAKRYEEDISTVSASFLLKIENDRVVAARIAYGGMAATPKRARAMEGALVGRPWSGETVDAAARTIDTDFTPMSDFRGSADYRRIVAANLLRRVYLQFTSPDTPVEVFA